MSDAWQYSPPKLFFLTYDCQRKNFVGSLHLRKGLWLFNIGWPEFRIGFSIVKKISDTGGNWNLNKVFVEHTF